MPQEQSPLRPLETWGPPEGRAWGSTGSGDRSLVGFPEEGVSTPGLSLFFWDPWKKFLIYKIGTTWYLPDRYLRRAFVEGHFTHNSFLNMWDDVSTPWRKGRQHRARRNVTLTLRQRTGVPTVVRHEGAVMAGSPVLYPRGAIAWQARGGAVTCEVP